MPPELCLVFAHVAVALLGGGKKDDVMDADFEEVKQGVCFSRRV